MGSIDRDYMYQDEGSFGTVRARAVSALAILIAINIVVWLLWQFAIYDKSLNQFMEANFLCRPSDVFNKWHFHTMLTCNFSHIAPRHILFNLLFFWVLGMDVEAFYGKLNFIALYIITGLTASVAQCGWEIATGSDIPSLGASGSVMGVAVVAAFLNPMKPFLFWGILPVPLWMLVALYALMDVTGVFGSSDNVAHAAHLGGALGGLLYYVGDLRIFSSRGGSSGILVRFKNFFRRSNFRSIEGYGTSKSGREHQEHTEKLWRETETKRKAELAARNATVDLETAQRVDELLAKISRGGMTGLNDEEREFLRKSSEKYKRG